MIPKLRWSGIGRFWSTCLIFQIVLLSFLRLICRCVAAAEKVCWKLRTLNFLLGICCIAALIILVWILCQMTSSDSVVSRVNGVLFDLRFSDTWSV